MRNVSLSKAFQEDAEEVKAILMMFGGSDAEVMGLGHRASGSELAATGAAQAEDHADRVVHGWSDKAFDAVREFVKHHRGRFQAEDVRAWARHVPPAPSLRAWGNVMVRAAKTGLIRNTGETEKVRNATAHCANASLWVAA